MNQKCFPAFGPPKLGILHKKKIFQNLYHHKFIDRQNMYKGCSSNLEEQHALSGPDPCQTHA